MSHRRLFGVLFLAVVLMWPGLALAQAPTPSSVTPKEWISAHPSAHLFSGQARAMSSSSGQSMTATWSDVIHQELLLMSHVHQCKRATSSRRRCDKELASKLLLRRRALKTRMPLWRGHAARTEDEVERARAHYQLGIGHLLLGEDKKGLELLKGLMEQSEQTPYSALAVASMGDYLWRKQSHQAAQTLYLRAASSPLQSIHPYAQYMQGWASAEMGKAGLALQAMSLSYSRILQAPEQLQHAMLALYVLEALAPVYAASAQADKAGAFIAQFKLTPRKQRAWLTRVASSYATQGQHQSAMQVYQRLAYKATPRQQTFYAYRWLESRKVATPRVDAMWSKVMVNWIGFIASLSPKTVDSSEIDVYRQAAVEEQRRCVEQTALRPELASWCRPALKAFVTKLPQRPDSQEMLFEYASLSETQQDMPQAKWAWQTLADIKGSVYREPALKRLKQFKK